MIFRNTHSADRQRIEQLVKVHFPPNRDNRAVAMIRHHRLPIAAYSVVAEQHTLVVGSIDFYHVLLPSGALVPLLGPVVVDVDHRNKGLGRALVEHGLQQIAGREDGVLIVGVEDYYRHYGFNITCTKNLTLQGEITPFVFMGLEFESGVFAREKGMVTKPI